MNFAPQNTTKHVAVKSKHASRMTLANIRRGTSERPVRLLVYGGEKIGKSTFASGAPGAVWLGQDSGTEHLSIARLPQPREWREVLDAITEVEVNGAANGIQTLVLDPINWFEPLIHLEVTGDLAVSLEKFDGGYGRGNSAALGHWRRLLVGLARVWEAGINVVLIAHSQSRKFEDPEGEGYERYELAMSPKPAGLLKQWVDAILLAKRDAYGKKKDGGARAKAYGTSAVMLHTEWAPAYDAGNRYGLPQTLPMSWRAFDEARVVGRDRTAKLRAQIAEGLAELADPALSAKVDAYMADPTIPLVEIANAVAEQLGERRKQRGEGAAETAEKDEEKSQ